MVSMKFMWQVNNPRFYLYNESQWSLKQHWTPLTIIIWIMWQHVASSCCNFLVMMSIIQAMHLWIIGLFGHIYPVPRKYEIVSYPGARPHEGQGGISPPRLPNQSFRNATFQKFGMYEMNAFIQKGCIKLINYSFIFPKTTNFWMVVCHEAFSIQLIVSMSILESSRWQ